MSEPNKSRIRSFLPRKFYCLWYFVLNKLLTYNYFMRPLCVDGKFQNPATINNTASTLMYTICT